MNTENYAFGKVYYVDFHITFITALKYGEFGYIWISVCMLNFNDVTPKYSQWVSAEAVERETCR